MAKLNTLDLRVRNSWVSGVSAEVLDELNKGFGEGAGSGGEAGDRWAKEVEGAAAKKKKRKKL